MARKSRENVGTETLSPEIQNLYRMGTNSGSDPIDKASDTSIAEMAWKLAEFDVLDQRQSAIAKEREQEGKAEICIDCGRRISKVRLANVKNVIRCLGCQKQFEAEQQKI